MSDKIKVIIEIPKEAYKMCQDLKKYDDGIVGPIAKGIPLDDVKAEIENLTYYWCEVRPRSVIDDVLKIIDNIGKGESER